MLVLFLCSARRCSFVVLAFLLIGQSGGTLRGSVAESELIFYLR